MVYAKYWSDMFPIQAKLDNNHVCSFLCVQLNASLARDFLPRTWIEILSLYTKLNAFLSLLQTIELRDMNSALANTANVTCQLDCMVVRRSGIVSHVSFDSLPSLKKVHWCKGLQLLNMTTRLSGLWPWAICKIWSFCRVISSVKTDMAYSWCKDYKKAFVLHKSSYSYTNMGKV